MLTIKSGYETMQAEPRAGSICTSECLYGECLELLAEKDGFSEVRNSVDNYCGFVLSENTQDAPPIPVTHRVIVRSSLLLVQPDIKSRTLCRLPLLSLLTLDDENGKNANTASGDSEWDNTKSVSYTHLTLPTKRIV